MTFKLHRPFWTHLPALACIATNAGLLLSVQLPARVPVHFKNGLPDRWGSPLELWLSMIGVQLLWVIGSVMLDEEWVRIEQQRRRFNWISLLDETVVGLMVGTNVKMVPQLSKPEPALSGQWPMALLFAGVAVVLAVLLELRRPYQPKQETAVDVRTLAQSIQPQFQPGGRWLYWEKQDPFWWRCLAILMPIVMVEPAVKAIQNSEWLALGLAAPILVIFVSSYGGLQVALTPGQFTVRLGRFGLPLLRLKLATVAKVEVVTFSPLLDFGGWGFYRYSLRRRAWGLFLSGGRGVIVQTKKGRRFLIGSNSPEKLAAASEVARIAATQ